MTRRRTGAAEAKSRKPAGAGPKPLTLPDSDFLKRLGQIAQHIGTRSFLVGGPVRDLVLGRSGPDLDIAVEDRSREYGAAVAKKFGGRFVYHSRFMTGTVSFPEQQDARPMSRDSGSVPSVSGLRPLSPSHIDITQTRAETYEMPAVLPAVRPASIVGDLGRRDFTINSMAMELTPGSFGMFIDPFDGRADVKQRRVRVLHARSFIDDPTRIFRCIRFAVRLGFAIEQRTLDLLRSAVEERLPAFLTPERILYELRLICAEPLVVPMVKALIRERVLDAAWRWTPRSRFLARLARLAAVPASSLPASTPLADLLFVYWLSVLPVTDRFPIRKEERDAAEALAGFGKVKPKLKRKLRPSTVYLALRGVPESALRILAVLETKAASASIRAFVDSYSKVRIATTGADLRAAGLKPGPVFREILDKLLLARLDGRIRTVTEERALLLRLTRQRDG
jgi:tRNA nucleotidyltransferase (CCA-adding enzyme)